MFLGKYNCFKQIEVVLAESKKFVANRVHIKLLTRKTKSMEIYKYILK